VADLQQRAQERTKELIALAAHHYGTPMPRPAVSFCLRGKTAGQVRATDGMSCVIRYNAELLRRHPEDFLRRTVPHETAHAVAFRLFGSRVKPHGPEWQAIMHLFGAEPERCHKYDTNGLQTRRLRRFGYDCACRTHRLTSIRHKRILLGQVYLCRHCGEALKPSGSADDG
jgi:SprT protein